MKKKRFKVESTAKHSFVAVSMAAAIGGIQALMQGNVYVGGAEAKKIARHAYKTALPGLPHKTIIFTVTQI